MTWSIFSFDAVAATKLTVDRQAKQRAVTQSSTLTELKSNGPNVARAW